MTVSVPSTHRRLVVGLIGLGILARLAPHPWNATPVMAIALFGVHQHGDGSVVLRLAPGAMPQADRARTVMAPFFCAITVETLLAEDKIIQYTSDLREAVA